MPTTDRHADALRASALRTMRTSAAGLSHGKGGEAARGSAVRKPMRAICTHVKHPAIDGYVKKLVEKTTWGASISIPDQVKKRWRHRNIPPASSQHTPTVIATYPHAGRLSTGSGWGYLAMTRRVVHNSNLQAGCTPIDCRLQGGLVWALGSAQKSPDYLQGSGKDSAPRSGNSWGRWNAKRSAR